MLYGMDPPFISASSLNHDLINLVGHLNVPSGSEEYIQYVIALSAKQPQRQQWK